MFDPVRIARLDMLTRGLGILAALICLAAPLYSHVSIDFTGTEMPILAFAAMVTIAVVYGRWRDAPRLARAAAMTADLIGFALVLGTLSYVAVAMNNPSAASTIAAMDHFIGFNWMDYSPVLTSNFPMMERVLWLAYSSMVPQLGILVLLFAVLNRHEWMRILVNGFCLMALVAIFISWLLPAVDADVHFGTLVVAKNEAGWSTPMVRVEHFLNLRDRFLTQIPVMDSTGLVTFPSFHTMSGVLFAVCFAQFRWAKWPAVVLNGLLIAATPVEGGHYLSDVLAGLALSTLILWAIFTYVRRPEIRPAPTWIAA